MLKETQNSIKARLYDMKYTPFLASYLFFFVYFNMSFGLKIIDKLLKEKMRSKIQGLFFIVLVAYIYILATFSYVSVYYTYTALPTLAILGFFGFVTFDSIKLTAIATFWGTLVLWVVTISYVSYIGVYLAYIAVPILLVSGFVALVTKDVSDDK